MLPTPINDQAQNAQPSTDNSATNNRQNKGTGFTNLGDILNANQGAGAKIGQAVGDSIAGQANSVQAGIQKSQDQFNTDKNTANTTANNAVQAGSTFARQPGTLGAPAETNDQYTQRLNSQGTDFNAIGKNLAKASYTGPNGLNNEDQIRSQASNVNALGQLAGTSNGQSQLLRSQVAQKGQYTQGQNSLDNLLLGTGGQQYLQPAVAQAQQVGSQAQNAILNSSAQANASRSAIDNSRTSALHNLRDSLKGDGTADSGNTTGIETIAANQAADYTKKAQRLQSLYSGKSNGNVIGAKDVTDADRDLLKHSADYGIANGNVYIDPNNTAAGYSALNSVGSNLTTEGLGKYKYTDPQRSAASNLSALLDDSQEQEDIAGQKFNSRIQNDTQAQDSQHALDMTGNGIRGTIADNAGKAAELQRVSDRVTGVGSTLPGQWSYNNNTNLSNLDGATRGDLFNTFKNATGQSIDSVSNSSGNKRLGDMLRPYLQTYQNQANTQTNQLNNNTMSIQDAALKRLMGQQ